MILPKLTKNETKLASKAIGLKSRKCKCCGKHIDVGPNYAYKKRRGETYDYYCSYSCFRDAE